MFFRKYFGALRSGVSSLAAVTSNRLSGEAKQNRWTLLFELLVEFMNQQFDRAGEIDRSDSINAARKYLDIPIPTLPVMNKVSFETVDCPVDSMLVYPNQKTSKVIRGLYLHGGGFVYNLEAHKLLLAHIVSRLKIPLLVPNYRLAPENPHPAALEDTYRSYEWLINNRGVDPAKLVIMGDSAGGNLMLELLLKLRDETKPKPALGVGLSPWTDLRNTGDSIDDNAEYDYLHKESGDRWAKYYAGDKPLDDPKISPVEAELHNLPPIYIQAGEAESIIDMIKVFYTKAKEEGVTISLDTWDGMIHVFQAFADVQPEARDALDTLRERIHHEIE